MPHLPLNKETGEGNPLTNEKPCLSSKISDPRASHSEHDIVVPFVNGTGAPLVDEETWAAAYHRSPKSAPITSLPPYVMSEGTAIRPLYGIERMRIGMSKHLRRALGKFSLNLTLVCILLALAGVLRFSLHLSPWLAMTLTVAWLVLALQLWTLGASYPMLRKIVFFFAGLIFSAFLWSSPSHVRQWSALHETAPQAIVENDSVTLYPVFFQQAAEVEPRALTVNLANLTHVDVILGQGSFLFEGVALLSFDFGSSGILSVSSVPRLEKNETFTSRGIFFREYEVHFLVEDEKHALLRLAREKPSLALQIQRLRLNENQRRTLFFHWMKKLNESAQTATWYQPWTVAGITQDILLGTVPEAVNPWDPRLYLGQGSASLLHRAGLFDPHFLDADNRAKNQIQALPAPELESHAFSQQLRQGKLGFD